MEKIRDDSSTEQKNVRKKVKAVNDYLVMLLPDEIPVSIKLRNNVVRKVALNNNFLAFSKQETLFNVGEIVTLRDVFQLNTNRF